MTATLSGKVSLGTYAGLKLVVRFFATGTQTEIFKSWNSTDASGNFTITGIPAGIYDVGIKADNSISILKTNQTFTEGTTTNIDFGALLRGDENGDDVGVLVDYSLWLTGNAKTGGCYGYSGNWIVTHP